MRTFHEYRDTTKCSYYQTMCSLSYIYLLQLRETTNRFYDTKAFPFAIFLSYPHLCIGFVSVLFWLSFIHIVIYTQAYIYVNVLCILHSSDSSYFCLCLMTKKKNYFSVIRVNFVTGSICRIIIISGLQNQGRCLSTAKIL